MTSPMIRLIQVVPEMMAALVCINRIEEFCLSKDREDERTRLTSARKAGHAATEKDEVGYKIPTSGPEFPNLNSHDARSIAVVAEQASFGWDDVAIVKDASFAIQYSQLTAITGPNASGKSTLLKVLLGELPLISGCIRINNNEIAYCDQTPWLPNCTIQECILGFGVFDAQLYGSVVYACALDEDFKQMDKGDYTKIGSKGATKLSGGQRQRIVSIVAMTGV
jgi:ATP-binding cassette subfamily C (CFTR/MRP) protein 1